MAQDLSALYNLLDHQIRQGESEQALTEFVCMLERKYEKQHLFIAWSVITTWVLKKVNLEML